MSGPESPRLDAMRLELAALNERRRSPGLTTREARRAHILEACLRAYSTDAELAQAELEASQEPGPPDPADYGVSPERAAQLRAQAEEWL